MSGMYPGGRATKVSLYSLRNPLGATRSKNSLTHLEGLLAPLRTVRCLEDLKNMMSFMKRKDNESGSYQELPTATDGDVHAVDVQAPPPRGQVQPPAFRDKWFAIAFLIHLAAIFVTAFLFWTGILKTRLPQKDDAQDPQANGMHRALFQRFLQEDSDTMKDEDFPRALFQVAFILSICVALGAVMLMMHFMAHKAKELIQVSWILAVALGAISGIVLIISAPDDITNQKETGKQEASLEPLGFSCLSVAFLLAIFAKANWKRIPYAACNLKIAVKVVRSNMGIFWLNLFGNVLLSILWFGMWFYVFGHILWSPWVRDHTKTVQMEDDDIISKKHNVHEEEVPSGGATWIILFMWLSLYWTWHVIYNTFHTTYAGVVGTWWFAPREASSFCSPALKDSMSRSLTYSFGSICFGSLVVTILEFVRSLVRSSARRRGNILACVCVWILAFLDQLAVYFNQYAFCYVGLYGYPYMQAGKQVISLFKYRVWTNLMNDVLVHRMIRLLSFLFGFYVAGGLAAFLAWIVLPTKEDKGIIVFGFWILYGSFAWFIAYRWLSVLQSCMDAVMVLYAEDPLELERNYPLLAAELRVAWREVLEDSTQSDSDNKADDKEIKTPLLEILSSSV